MSGLPSLEPLFKQSAKRTRDIFASCPDDSIKEEERRCVSIEHAVPSFMSPSARLRLSVKINDEYKPYKELPPTLLAQQGPALIALSLVDEAANPKYNDQDWPVRGKVVVAWKQLGMMLRWSQIKICFDILPHGSS